MSGATTNRSAIKSSIDFRGLPANPVTFEAEGTADYARPDPDHDGICDACHYLFKAAHIDEYEDDDCTTCHGTHCADTPEPGNPGMFATGGLPVDEGHDLHYTAPDAKMAGALACEDCHSSTQGKQFFKDEQPLATTTACDACHGGPGGAFPGVDELNDATIGAKANWTNGIYEEDGITLKAGKGAWCATCHDDVPAHSQLTGSEAPDDIVIDNPDAVFVDEVDWNSYSGPGESFYGTDMRYKAAGGGSTATWTPDITQAGSYNVYAWWSAYKKRASNAPYTVNHTGGSDTIRISQRIDGGKWNLLGNFNFTVGTSGSVVLSDDGNGAVVADAVKFEWAPPDSGITIDNPDAVFVDEVDWNSYSGPGESFYGTDMRYKAAGGGSIGILTVGRANLSMEPICGTRRQVVEAKQPPGHLISPRLATTMSMPGGVLIRRGPPMPRIQLTMLMAQIPSG
jgi:hypothetical protein